MEKALLIAEKPSLMRTIQDVYNKHRDELPYSITFRAQSGHLLTTLMPNELNASLKKWSWDNLPIHPENYGGWKYKIIQQKKTGKFPTPQERYADIERELKSGNYDFVIHAGDPDQEGELLVNMVLANVGNTLPVKRFWTNDTTEGAVLEALKNLLDDQREPMLINLLKAGYARQHADYRFGINCTRAATLKAEGNAMVSLGRVESPILAIVVKRENEIRSFKPTTTYGVKAVYADGFEGQLYDNANEKSDEDDDEKSERSLVYFQTEKEAKDLLTSLTGKPGKIVSYKAEKKETLAPKLFKLSTLQIEAGRMGYNADRTLSIVQSLYEKQYMSYPRTDCEYLSSQEDFMGILWALNKIPEYTKYIRSISRTKIEQVRHTKKWINDKALKESGHSALRPTTKVPDFSTLSQDEKNIYDLVSRRMIAIFLPPLVQDKTKLLTDIGGKLFKSSGKTMLDPGYTDILNIKITDKEIPLHKEGDILDVSSLEIAEKTTTCPSRFTSSDLIAVCENPIKYLNDESLKKLGKDLKIGTPATRAGIITKLVTDYHYLQTTKKGKKEYLSPTPNGEAIIRGVGDLMICRVDMTGIWEEQLQDIRAGRMDAELFDQKMIEDVNRMVQEIFDRDVHIVMDGGRPIYETVAVEWKGKQKKYIRQWGGHRFTDEEISHLAAGEEITFQTKYKSGDPVEVTGCLQEYDYKGKKHFGFRMNSLKNLNPGRERVPVKWDGKETSFARIFAGHRFTNEEIERLLQRKTIQFIGKNKQGDDCRVTGHLDMVLWNGKQFLGFKMDSFENLNPEKEIVSGEWRGEKVQFRRVIYGHRLTNEEISELLKDHTIEFSCQKNNGMEQTVSGHLEKTLFKGKEYTVVKVDDGREMVTGVFKKKQVSFSRVVFGQHRLTDEEVDALLRGEEIVIHGLQSARGNEYGILAVLGNHTYKGHKIFGVKKKRFL